MVQPCYCYIAQDVIILPEKALVCNDYFDSNTYKTTHSKSRCLKRDRVLSIISVFKLTLLSLA